MKKLFVSALAAVTLAGAMITAALADGIVFTDVPTDAWYYGDVEYAVEMGLINGKTTTTYCPDDNLTYAEAVKLAACMNQLYNEGAITLKNGNPWYQTYVDYCIDNGIIDKEYNYNEKATRSGYMDIFAYALPDEALKAINSVPDDSIPDVPSKKAYAPGVYKLYRAGILQGSDEAHSCKPLDNIKRSEVAAILSRMMDETKRVKFSMGDEEQSPEEAKPENTEAEISTSTRPALPTARPSTSTDSSSSEDSLAEGSTSTSTRPALPTTRPSTSTDSSSSGESSTEGSTSTSTRPALPTTRPSTSTDSSSSGESSTEGSTSTSTRPALPTTRPSTSTRPTTTTPTGDNPLTVTEQSKKMAVKGTATAYVTVNGGKDPYVYKWQYQHGGTWHGFYEDTRRQQILGFSTINAENDVISIESHGVSNLTVRCVIIDSEGTEVVTEPFVIIFTDYTDFT